MEINIIKDLVVRYIKELLIEYSIPSGYHDLKILSTNGIIDITLISLTDDPLINIIPKLKNRYSYVTDELISRLRKLSLEYDYLIKSIDFDTVKFHTQITKFRSYLNLNVIPVELINEITKFFVKKEYDYFNLLEVLKISEYPPELIKHLKKEYIKDNMVLLYGDYDRTYWHYSITKATIDSYGKPILIRQLFITDSISKQKILREEHVTNLTGNFIYSKIWDHDGNLISEIKYDNNPNNNVIKL